MARFLLSPGVLTREVDNSQYAATQPTGNVAALVGYAEKGPFEPTIVSGTQEFNRMFGYTLEDAPYLAQAAYKYFGQGQNLLIVRAGNDADPDIYPMAAQYASKTIRLGERDIEASKGWQTFSRTKDLTAGTFAPGAEFGFQVTADHRAFVEPKDIEKWGATVSEPTLDVDMVSKFALDSASSKKFEVNVKENISGTTNSTHQKSGSGNREGTSLGDTVTFTAYNYAKDGTFEDVRANYIYFSGTHGALVVGNDDMAAGFDFATENKELRIELDGKTYATTFDHTCSNASEIVEQFNTLRLESAADEDTGDIVNLTDDLEAFVVQPASGEEFIGLRRKAVSIASSTTKGFSLPTSDMSTTLGWTVNMQYLDAESIFGTFHSEDDSGNVYDGDIIFNKEGSTESGAESFEEPIDISIEASSQGNWTLAEIQSAINTKLAEGHTEDTNNPARAKAAIANDGKVKIETELAAADGYKAIVRIKNNASNSLIDLLGLDSSEDGKQERPVGESLLAIRAAEKGSYGNDLVLRTETKAVQTTPSGPPEHHYNVFVLLKGKEVSVYQRVNWDDPSSNKYLPTLLESDPYIRLDAEDEDGNFVMEVLPDGDWTLGDETLPEGVSSLSANIVSHSVGTNGWESDSEGIINSMNADLIKGLEKIYNPEVYDFNLVAAPGSAAGEVQKAVLELCESRHDCFGVIDAAPFGIGLGVKQNTNHVSEVNDAVSHLNSSYVGVYWPWLQDYDADNKQYVWLPPSAYALTQMVYTDNVADPWYATAGLSRGKVTALDVEYSPTRSERDILYGETNIVNPIVKFVGEGIAIWGQKTAQRTQSALDRINVRRLMIYAEKLIARMARGFLFEQNDAANWAAFSRQANAILEPIRQRRGLTTYQVVCDASTNTPDLINQNIMSGKIFVQPTKTIEFIEVEFTINAAGEVEFAE